MKTITITITEADFDKAGMPMTRTAVAEVLRAAADRMAAGEAWMYCPRAVFMNMERVARIKEEDTRYMEETMVCPSCKQPCEADSVDKSVCCGARLWGQEVLKR